VTSPKLAPLFLPLRAGVRPRAGHTLDTVADLPAERDFRMRAPPQLAQSRLIRAMPGPHSAIPRESSGPRSVFRTGSIPPPRRPASRRCAERGVDLSMAPVAAARLPGDGRVRSQAGSSGDRPSPPDLFRCAIRSSRPIHPSTHEEPVLPRRSFCGWFSRRFSEPWSAPLVSQPWRFSGSYRGVAWPLRKSCVWWVSVRPPARQAVVLRLGLS
jgi:hypothetical protein